MTRVYLFCREGTPLPVSAASLLPSWRRERLERLRRPESRQESLSAGLLYAFALRAWGADPGREVTFLPAGKPILAGRQDAFFSLSHSGDYAMCAVSGRPVGADVQQERPVKLSLARRFHPREQEWLSRLPEQERQAAFFRLWTRKEAWIKAESGERALSLAEADVIHTLPGRYFRDYELPGGFHAAVCCGENDIAEPVTVGRQELLTGLS